MDQEIVGVASEIAEEVSVITHEDLTNSIATELIGSSSLLEEIKKSIKIFLKKVEQYEKITSEKPATIGQALSKLESQKEFIYADFFKIQNLINAFLGQKIVMSYIHVDEYGRREVRISDNTVDHLGITRGVAWNGNPFYKLGYDFSSHYETLKNGLPDDDNEGLQATAMEVERRYFAYKKRVLWYVGQWKGYRLTNRGPINEAFMNFYIHKIKLESGMEENIDKFMTSDNGAIKADATRGYLIGDVYKDGVQYAVKGAFGSPQGTKEIIKEFKKIQSEDFSDDAIWSFINKFTKEELDKGYKPQIKEMTQRSLSAFLKYHQKELEKEININLTI